MTLACGMDHIFETGSPFKFQVEGNSKGSQVVYAVDAQPGFPLK